MTLPMMVAVMAGVVCALDLDEHLDNVRAQVSRIFIHAENSGIHYLYRGQSSDIVDVHSRFLHTQLVLSCRMLPEGLGCI